MHNYGKDTVLSWKSTHRWLGLQWREDGDLSAHAAMTIAACSVLVTLLAQLVAKATVPMAVILLLFTVKVESKLRFGRWLWGSTQQGMQLLDDAYHAWAKQLLGIDIWKNGDVAAGELGWAVSGGARAVYDIALLR